MFEITKEIRMQRVGKRKSKTLQSIEKTVTNQEMMGFIKNGLFHDLQGKTYEITDTDVQIEEDMPAKARLTSNGIKLVKKYQFNFKKIKNYKPTHKNKIKLKQNTEYQSFGDLKVLIVGARNKNKYTDRLKKHGVTVTWHNPFEDGPQLLANEYRRADIVLLCTRHISHDCEALINSIQKNERKISRINKDNTEIIANRVRIKAIELGLLR